MLDHGFDPIVCIKEKLSQSMCANLVLDFHAADPSRAQFGYLVSSDDPKHYIVILYTDAWWMKLA